MTISRLLSFSAGLAGTAGLAIVALAAAMIAGAEIRAPLYVLAGGVVLVLPAAWGMHRPDLDHGAWRVGGAAGAILAAGSMVVEGFASIGLLQVAMVVIGVAVAVADPGWIRERRVSPTPAGSLAMLAVVAVVLARIVVEGGPLGHDESALALKGRAWAAGTPDTGWSIHRGVGMSGLAALLIPLSDAEATLRGASVVLSVGTVVSVWWLGRVVHSDRAGIAAAVVFAVAPTFLRRGAEFLTDLPSTGLLLVATALMWRWLTADEVRDGALVLAVVAGAAAFYVRYQSILSLGLVAAVSAVLFRHRIRRSAGTVAGAALLGVGLLLPHLVWATFETGVPWGVILFTGAAGRLEYPGQGLVDYAVSAPYLLAGPLGAVAIATALAWFVVRMRWRDGGRPLAVFLVTPAVLQVAVLGLISHGEPRFVFYPVGLLVVAGAIGWLELGERMPVDLRRSLAVGAAVALVVAMGEAGSRMDRNAEARGRGFGVIVEASETAASEADRCAIMTGYLPQTTWTTGCPSFEFHRTQVQVPGPVGAGGAMILFENGVRQPFPDIVDGYRAEAGADPITVQDPTGGVGDAAVYLFSG